MMVNSKKSDIVSTFRVGCVLNGVKVVRSNMRESRFRSGELFCLGFGCPNGDNVSSGEQPYEECVVEYSPAELRAIVGRELDMFHEGVRVDGRLASIESAGCSAGTTLRSLFGELSAAEEHSEADKRLLIQLVVRLSDSDVTRCLLSNIDKRTSDFEQLIFAHIFADCSLESLAEQSHCSLTSFKRCFRQHFNSTPHKWFMAQRMEHARRLLALTSKSVAEIATECMYPNVSHFIKRFRYTYNITPMAYRQSLLDEKPL